jgi:hypothetical protein
VDIVAGAEVVAEGASLVDCGILAQALSNAPSSATPIERQSKGAEEEGVPYMGRV